MQPGDGQAVPKRTSIHVDYSLCARCAREAKVPDCFKQLHSLQMEAVALIYMPKNCMYMPEPSSGNHYTLLPLTRDKDICIGVLSTFTAAKLMGASTHSSSGMGVHLKLPGRFGPDLDNDGLISEPALCCGPIWKNADFIVRGDDGRPLLENGDPVVMESPIKVVLIDQYTPLNCTALTNVGYEPKFANDAFAFRETVVEMRQHLNRTKAEVAKQTATEQKVTEPMITEVGHQEALAATHVPMYASKTSNIEVAPMPGMQFIDAAKYRSFLGIKPDKGEEVATASAGTLAQAPKDSATMDTVPPPAKRLHCQSCASASVFFSSFHQGSCALFHFKVPP